MESSTSASASVSASGPALNSPILGGATESTSMMVRIMNYKWIIIIMVVILALFLLWYFTSDKTTTITSSDEYVPGNSTNQEQKEAELMFFYVDWCPHCKTAKPEWDKLKGEYDGKDVNGYTLIFTELNCTEENAETDKLLNTYNVEGYPTIKMIKDGQVIEYDAKPNYDTLVQFINSAV